MHRGLQTPQPSGERPLGGGAHRSPPPLTGQMCPDIAPQFPERGPWKGSCVFPFLLQAQGPGCKMLAALQGDVGRPCLALSLSSPLQPHLSEGCALAGNSTLKPGAALMPHRLCSLGGWPPRTRDRTTVVRGRISAQLRPEPGTLLHKCVLALT